MDIITPYDKIPRSSAAGFFIVGYLGVHKKRIIIENLPLPLFAKEG